MEKTTKLTLLTGANGGLGLGIADSLLANGYRNIAFQYRSSDESIQKVLEKYELPAKKHLYKADLTNETDLKNMRESIENNLGKVSNLINLAGGSTNGVSWKLSKDDFQKVMDMNMTTTFLTCREFIPSMREEKHGRIVNVSSVVGFKGVPGASHYCAAKAAIAGFSKAISLELVNKNITVNTIGLGYCDAGIWSDIPESVQASIVDSIPMKRLGQAKEIAGLVEYLTSEEGAYMTGQVLHLNGGLI